MIKKAKIRRQIQDLRGLCGALCIHFGRSLRLLGNADAHGCPDGGFAVWHDIEDQNLAYQTKRIRSESSATLAPTTWQCQRLTKTAIAVGSTFLQTFAGGSATSSTKELATPAL
jgi:hypothetical protein